MSKGLAAAIMLTGREAFGAAYPGEKVTPPGYLEYLLTNKSPKVVSDGIDDGSGYIRDVKVRMMQRGVPGQSITEDNCSVQSRPGYIDLPIPTTQFRALGFTFEDDLIAQFERDAAGTKTIGTPTTPIQNEVWDVIMSQANGLLADINNDLLTIQAANFGINKANGLNTPKTVNFPLNATNNDLTQGMTGLMADAYLNEMKLAGSSIVGSGLITNYVLQQPAKTAAQNGLNTRLQMIPDYKYDPSAGTIWGANQFGLFEKDAVAFINIARFRGFKAGQKGPDYFFTLKLPIEDSIGQGSLSAFEFDVQLTYRTCPMDVQIGTPGIDNPPVRMGRGWNIILMSSYAQMNIPVNAYNPNDVIYGNNGTYRFTATNA